MILEKVRVSLAWGNREDLDELKRNSDVGRVKSSAYLQKLWSEANSDLSKEVILIVEQREGRAWLWGMRILDSTETLEIYKANDGHKRLRNDLGQ